MRITIAGVSIDFDPESVRGQKTRFARFHSWENDAPDLRINLNPVDFIERPQGDIFLDDVRKWILRNTEDHAVTFFQCSDESPENELLYSVNVADNWKMATISFIKDHRHIDMAIDGIIGYVLFKNRILFHEGLVLHASAVGWQGKGVLFSAPSGTGKSTQARLWETLKGAVTLNDDSPAIRVFKKQAIVYGTPWGGSSQIFRNEQAPVSAIVMLEQAKENFVRRLSPAEAVASLLPRCYLPYHDAGMINMVCSILEKLVTATPVYQFRCRPDKDAVEMICCLL